MTMTAQERREWLHALTPQELRLLVAAIISELHFRGWLAPGRLRRVTYADLMTWVPMVDEGEGR
jgi:hypothetical protein